MCRVWSWLAAFSRPLPAGFSVFVGPSQTMFLRLCSGTEGTYFGASIWAMGSMIEVEPDLVLFIYED